MAFLKNMLKPPHNSLEISLNNTSIFLKELFFAHLRRTIIRTDKSSADLFGWCEFGSHFSRRVRLDRQQIVSLKSSSQTDKQVDKFRRFVRLKFVHLVLTRLVSLRRFVRPDDLLFSSVKTANDFQWPINTSTW